MAVTPTEVDDLARRARDKLSGALERLDSFIEEGAAEDDEYAADPLYLDYLREKREEKEADHQRYLARMREIVAISRRNRGER